MVRDRTNYSIIDSIVLRTEASVSKRDINFYGVENTLTYGFERDQCKILTTSPCLEERLTQNIVRDR